jgi:hypothetical protein
MVLLPAMMLLAINILSGVPFQAKVPEAVKKAQAKLTDTPDDPDANLIVGKHLAFDLGDWEKALSHLAKGADKGLAATAQKDLDGGATGPQKVGIGDAWVEGIKKFPKNRAPLVDRASKWYADAWPDLDEAGKAKLRDRLQKLYSGPAGPARPLPLAGWPGSNSAGAKIEAAPARAHSGAYALKITPANKPGLRDILHSESTLVKPGSVLEISFWALTDGTDSLEDKLSFALFEQQGAGAGQKEIFLSADTPIWKFHSAKLDVPAAGFKTMVGFLVASTKGEIWLDEISVKVDGKELVRNGGFEEK